MNKKEHVSVSEQDLKKVLDGLGHSRESIADALGVTSTTLRKWIKDGRVPKVQWERLNSEELKKTLAIQKRFGANHYVVPSTDVDANHVLYSKRPSSEPDDDNAEMTQEVDLSPLTLDQLVDEIENRGWAVQISRKTESK